MATFGTILKKLREEAELSQRALAERAGVGQKTISWWETDVKSPTLPNVQKLCKALGVTCDVFFQADEPKPAAKAKSKKGK